MQTALRNSLEKNGYTVNPMEIKTTDTAAIATAISEQSTDKNVLLVIREWLTDAMMNFGLTYDIALQVLDGNAEVLAEATSSGTKEKIGGAGLERQNSRSAFRAFESKISRLFNDPAIREALD